MPVKQEPAYSIEQADLDVGGLRGQVDALNEYAELTTAVILGVAVSDQPGNTNSLAANQTPATQETWHAFSPLSNSWSVPAGGFAQYRITVQNELQISAVILAPSSSADNVTIATFPVGYRPLSTHIFPVAGGAIPTGATTYPQMTLTSAGVMQAQGVAVSATVGIEVKVPLDV